MTIKFEPWEIIAGSSFGTWTQQEVVERLCSRLDVPMLKNLQDDEIDDYIDGLIELANDYAPPFCAIQWADNEVRVLPYVDEWETPRYEDIPENCSDEYLYVVNDHGNVTLYGRQANGEYLEIWSMV